MGLMLPSIAPNLMLQSLFTTKHRTLFLARNAVEPVIPDLCFPCCHVLHFIVSRDQRYSNNFLRPNFNFRSNLKNYVLFESKTCESGPPGSTKLTAIVLYKLDRKTVENVSQNGQEYS